MKKFLLLLLLVIFFTPLKTCAQGEISFIYINGSNTNTEKSKEEFIEGAYKLHNNIIKNFTKDDFVYETILKKQEINKEPIPFYWGDLSKRELEVIQEDFDFLKAISPKPARFVRQFIAMCLHDAIWVSKHENMYPIIKKLHKEVMKEYKKGNKTVLMGYSAGTFIVYQYLFFKMPVINLNEELMKAKNNEAFDDNINNIDKEKFANYIKEKNITNTCTDAVFLSGLVTYDINNTFIFEDDYNIFKQKVDKLDEYTKQYCAPDDAILGAFNFASPFALFYSNMFDEEYKMSKVMALSYKYIVENNMFWLTVNYSNDPLGFPSAKNLNHSDFEQLTGEAINPNGGFIYDKSDKASPKTFILAHLSYFKSRKYAKILKDSLKEGYEHFYLTETK